MNDVVAFSFSMMLAVYTCDQLIGDRHGCFAIVTVFETNASFWTWTFCYVYCAFVCVWKTSIVIWNMRRIYDEYLSMIGNVICWEYDIYLDLERRSLGVTSMTSLSPSSSLPLARRRFFRADVAGMMLMNVTESLLLLLDSRIKRTSDVGSAGVSAVAFDAVVASAASGGSGMGVASTWGSV